MTLTIGWGEKYDVCFKAVWLNFWASAGNLVLMKADSYFILIFSLLSNIKGLFIAKKTVYLLHYSDYGTEGEAFSLSGLDFQYILIVKSQIVVDSKYKWFWIVNMSMSWILIWIFIESFVSIDSEPKIASTSFTTDCSKCFYP